MTCRRRKRCKESRLLARGAVNKPLRELTGVGATRDSVRIRKTLNIAAPVPDVVPRRSAAPMKIRRTTKRRGVGRKTAKKVRGGRKGGHKRARRR